MNKAELWAHYLNKDYTSALHLASEHLKAIEAHDALYVAALSLIQLDQIKTGKDWALAALAVIRPNVDRHADVVRVLLDKKDYRGAALFLQPALDRFPGNPTLHYLKGVCLAYTGNYSEALAQLDYTVSLELPSVTSDIRYYSLLAKAFCYRLLNQHPKAMAIYEAMYPTLSGAYLESTACNHVTALIECGEPHQAIQVFDKYCKDSTLPGSVFNRAFLRIGTGQWPECWQDYKQRYNPDLDDVMKSDLPTSNIPTVPQPIAQSLSDIHDKHLFVYAEQGFGDVIQFVRFLPDLAHHAASVTFGCPPSLRRLATCLTTDNPIHVITETSQAQESLFDVALPLLDAPAIFHTTPKTIPAIPHFDIPDRETLNFTSKTKRRIGLCWAGSARPSQIQAHAIDKRRSIPFALMSPILNLTPHYEFVSLQMPDHHVHDARISHQPLHSDFDFYDTALIIKQLDQVITVDTAVAHLAASLNVQTWLLSRYDTCWRWFWCNEESPYYHNTPWYPAMYIFRQKAPYTWTNVIDNVTERLLLQ